MKCPKGHEAVIKVKGATSLESDYLQCVMCGWTWKPGDDSISVKQIGNDSGGPMVNQLKPEKEEEVKILLKTHSIREIIKKTGVVSNTIARIRNENFTDQERAELKKSANIKGRLKRELEKDDSTSAKQIKKEEVMEEKITKICIKCKKELPATNEYFSKNKAAKDGFEYQCKDCRRKRQADYRAKKAKSEGGRSVRKLPKLRSPVIDPITRASPDEILIALRNGIRRETAKEIFESLGQAFVQIKERFA